MRRFVVGLRPRIIFFAALLTLGAAATHGDHPGPPLVLVIHSYHPGFRWTSAVQEGIVTQLLGPNGHDNEAIDLRTEYLDAKRYPGDTLHESYELLLRRKYAESPPDLILSSDDDALDFLFRHRNGLFGVVPVVFGGLDANQFDPKLLEGRSGYTGIVESLDLESTLELIQMVQPNANQVAIVHDRTRSGLEHRDLFESLDQTDAYPEMVFLDDGDGLTHEQLVSGLADLPDNTPVLFAGFYLDSHGVVFRPEQIVPDVSRAATGPVYAHHDDLLGLGIVGGKLLSGSVHGASLAQMALRTLDAQSTEMEPVAVESSNRYMADYQILQRFGISMKQFPPRTEFINMPTTFWDRYRRPATVAAVGVVALLILIGLLAASLRRAKVIDRRLVAAVEAKEMLMREMNHRVKNNLSLITSLVRLKAQAASPETTDDPLPLDDIVHQIDAIRIIHEKLYQSSDVTVIDMKTYLRELLETVFTTFSGCEVSLEFRVQEIDLPTGTAIPVGLIVNEIATNAIKHAFTTGADARFSIELKTGEPVALHDQAAPVTMILSNSGKPIPPTVDPKNPGTLGMQLIHALTEQLGGSMQLTRKPLTTFRFTFPANGGQW